MKCIEKPYAHSNVGQDRFNPDQRQKVIENQVKARFYHRVRHREKNFIDQR